MSLTREESELLEKREAALSQDEQYTIEMLFRSLYSRAKQYDFPAATDDRAAKLEAAMVKFIIDSRK